MFPIDKVFVSIAFFITKPMKQSLIKHKKPAVKQALI